MSDRDRRTELVSFLGGPPEDAGAILAQWDAVADWFEVGHHTFPKPVWGQRPYEHSGAEAWRHLPEHIGAREPQSPMSIYLHVPFCARRCGFCDLYSIPLPERQRHMEDAFAAALLGEIEAWSALPPLERRPVTTVHFGGGTPNFLSPCTLKRIVEECRRRFGATADTEWALESTCRLLTDRHLEELAALGFTRLHVGVQTLDDPTRKLIGREDDSEAVLDRLVAALRRGFVVSVDLLYGLPGQTPAKLVSTMERLAVIGVHGFSLYQLQTCDQNRAFLQRIGADKPAALLNYALFQTGNRFLRRRGYRKTFFTHFALPPDRNLYYRHVLRGEDLLALGPTADGVFGRYVYRHHRYKEYAGTPVPGLEGGMCESAMEQATRPAVAALMTNTIGGAMFRELDAAPLLDLWLACAILERGAEADRFELTANGSWFMTQMVSQLRTRVAARMAAAGNG